jgi:hypothetical protein
MAKGKDLSRRRFIAPDELALKACIENDLLMPSHHHFVALFFLITVYHGK